MLEFRINSLMTLKLEDQITNIYINGELFNQCKHVTFKRKVRELENLFEFTSMDELIDNTLDEDIENDEEYEQLREIGPVEEFWVHCSNLQIWNENDYSSFVLHRNLAFPLLKRLTEVGDVVAKKVFQEEIIKRLESGYHPVIEFLQSEGFTKYIDRDDLFLILLNYKEYEVVCKLFENEMEEIVWHYGFDQELLLEYYDILIFDKSVVGLNLSKRNLEEFPKEIKCLPALLYLNLDNNNLKSLPEFFGNLKDLKELSISSNKLEKIPDDISELINLEYLFLDSNNLKTIPKLIGKLKSLKLIYLDANYIEELPDSIGELKSIRNLGLMSNRLKDLPLSIKNLESLRRLDVRCNELYKLNEEILYIENLEEIHIDENLKSEETTKKLKKKGVRVLF